MAIPWGPIITTTGQLGGDILGYVGQKQTNAANAAQARAQMDFQAQQNATAYQRAVDDMRKAGLNPALAYQQGGAGSGGGAKAEMANALAGFKGSAAAAAETFNSIRATTAAVNAQEAQAKKTDAEATQINLESAGRLKLLDAEGSLRATDARFADTTFNTRAGLAASQYGESLAKQNREWEEYYQFKDMRPLLMESIRANIENTRTGTRDTTANAILKELQHPTARNTAKAAESAWMRNIHPYIGDANALAQIIATGAGTFAIKNLLSPKAAGKKSPLSIDWDDIITRPPK